MKLSALLAPLIAARVPHDQIMAVIVAFEAEQGDALERRRQADAERQARKRSRDVTLRHSDRSLTGAGDARVEDKTLTSEIEPLKEEKKERRAVALWPEFEEFWAAYPNKVGKPKARASFQAALQNASIEVILSGLRRYIAAKPADRAWLNPATFLNQERWADQPAVVVPMSRGSPAGKVTPYDVGRRLLDEMETANARTTAEIGGHQPAPRMLSSG